MVFFLLWLALPAQALPFAADRCQALLQRFADQAYLKGFRHLGDRRDFDHGHVLYDSNGASRAILYHTQELGRYESGEFAAFDSSSRNWLQWLDSGAVENANGYKRLSYPDDAAWRTFKALELPAFEAHHTITAKMLDPERLGFEVAASRQWVFARRPCGAAALKVRLGGDTVCLASQ